MSTPARDASGEVLELADYDGRELKLISARAHAPGQRLVLQVDVSIGFMLELKSVGSVKREDGRYLVRARPTTLSKHAREALEKLFASSAG